MIDGYDIFDNSVDGIARSHEYTKAAVRKIQSVINSEKFADKDASDIERFLLTQMKLFTFSEYIKRYLYLKAELTDRFSTVTNDVYMQIIMDSFAVNRAPHSFEPTTVRWKKIVERWLTQDSVQRSTVFLLGFGLGMTAEEVNEFLIKGIGEGDFDFNDPTEAIYWYCFKNGLTYAEALELKEKYDGMSDNYGGNVSLDELLNNPTEENMLAWLGWIRQADERSSRNAIRQGVFRQLYSDCQRVIAMDHQDSGEDMSEADVTSGDIEKFLCDGIPRTKSGNLQKASDSALNRQFRNKRITRQRLDALLKGELEVTRFDIISLQFLIAAKNEDDEPKDRCMYFIDDVNELLTQCGMMQLYSTNPYEAFVQMCLLKDDDNETPLEAYSRVWAMSYEEA